VLTKLICVLLLYKYIQIIYKLSIYKFDLGSLQNHKWENCMTIDQSSWGYRREAALNSYLNVLDLITTLAETVRFGLYYRCICVFVCVCVLVHDACVDVLFHIISILRC